VPKSSPSSADISPLSNSKSCIFALDCIRLGVTDLGRGEYLYGISSSHDLPFVLIDCPYSPFLQTPPNQDLRRLLPMFLAELYQDWIFKSLLICSHDRAISLQYDLVVLAVFDDVALLTPWVDLDLVDRWFRRRQFL